MKTSLSFRLALSTIAVASILSIASYSQQPLEQTMELPEVDVAGENSLIFHVVKSPGLNWSTPRTISRTTIMNSVKGKKYPIGHITMEVRCGNQSVSTGMTQRYFNEGSRLVRKQKYGLGVLFHTFHGKHQDTEDVQKDLKYMLKTDRLGIVKILISPESCQAMQTFQRNFIAKGMGVNYGMLSRPLEGEGGGCSAYAMAYPAVGGFLEPWMIEQWGRYYRIPRGAVGGPMTGLRVGVIDSMYGGPKYWATENEDAFPLFFYDPDKIFDWAKALYDGQENLLNSDQVGTVKRIPVTEDLVLGNLLPIKNSVFAIELDRRNIRPTAANTYRSEQRQPIDPILNPTPLESLWPKEIQIQKDLRLRMPELFREEAGQQQRFGNR